MSLKAREIIPTVLVAAVVAAAVIVWIAGSCSASAGYFDTHEARKEAAHTMAEAARELGYGEDSAIIKAAKEHYNAAQDEIDWEAFKKPVGISSVLYCENVEEYNAALKSVAELKTMEVEE